VRAGLEVHQQLATGKLFCDCPAELSDRVELTVARRLRATGGENHAVDAAAAFQAARGYRYRYESGPSNCLVELDEEPPHALNAEAVGVALTVARLLHATPVDEIEVMRKIVVDGSTTSGFQRTALVAVGGILEIRGKRHAIQSICLEEDAGRKVSEAAGEVTYRLDRLGIPLIEIATGPDITSGPEAREVAEEIGALLRSTGRVRRGIGTIREDLNVSTPGGTRVEIKGVQELRLIQRYVEREEERQARLLATRDQLRAQGATVPDGPPVDLGDALRGRLEGPAGEVLKRGGEALGLALPGFAGTLRPPGDPPERLGRELADRARAVGLKGLLHSDELPGHGVDAAATEAVRARLGVGPNDAFVLVVGPTRDRAEAALAAVRDRARAAVDGLPGETRDPLPDGRTRYSRPLPGRDRMYPETDVPPVPVTAERLAVIEAHLPETRDVRRRRLEQEYGLGPELVRQLDGSGEGPRFESLVHRGHPAALVARLLAQDYREAEAGLGDAPAPDLDEATLDALLTAVRAGAFSKEGVPRVLSELLRGAPSVAEAARRAGVEGMGRDELVGLAEEVVRANAPLIRARGEAAFSGLMGELMRAVRGRRDGREVAQVLREAIGRVAATPGAGG
jgi:glutamyl-tRNA(Gln) amidotransferase subunit E